MKIKWIDIYLKQAEEMVYNDETAEAIELMESLLFYEPGYAQLHNNIGWAYQYYTDEVDKAELHFIMAIKFDKYNASPYLHLANHYLRKRRYSEAVKILQEGLLLPAVNRLSFYETLGRAYELQGEFRKALCAYKQGLIDSTGAESVALMDSIKRCRKKRLTMFFTYNRGRF